MPMRVFVREERGDRRVEVILLSRGGSVGVERKAEFTEVYIRGYSIFFVMKAHMRQIIIILSGDMALLVPIVNMIIGDA